MRKCILFDVLAGYMIENNTILVSKIKSLFSFLEKYSINCDQFLLSVGLEPKNFNSPDKRITLDQLITLIHKGAVITGDIDIGLHLGEIFTGIPNILYYLMMNCEHLMEAIEKYIKYHQVIDNTRKIAIKQKDDLVIINLWIDNDIYNNDKHLIDSTLCCFLHFFNYISGRKITPIEVRFRFPAPIERKEYKRIFNCPLNFSNKMNALVLDKKDLYLPLSTHNENLKQQFEIQTSKLLQQLFQPATYSEKVSQLILKGFTNHPVPLIYSVEEVAQQLALSVRALQMKLKDEKITYSQLLNKIRIETAVDYLKDKTVSIGEISYFMGFSEPSAFHRFFKKVTGSTPQEYRNNYMY